MDERIVSDDSDFGEDVIAHVMASFDTLALRPEDSEETRRRLRLAHLAGLKKG